MNQIFLNLVLVISLNFQSETFRMKYKVCREAYNFGQYLT